MTKFKVDLDGQKTEIEVMRQGDHLRVTWEGKTADLQILHADGATFIMGLEGPDGTRQCIRAAAHVDGDKRQLWVNGRSFSYKRVRRRLAGREDSGSGSLAASIPAVVSEILVKVGDAVEAGHKLILLESMKMIIPIQAPYAGVVAAIHCQSGESVQAGVPLLQLEELKDL